MLASCHLKVSLWEMRPLCPFREVKEKQAVFLGVIWDGGEVLLAFRIIECGK
jgi:hypothetical protein